MKITYLILLSIFLNSAPALAAEEWNNKIAFLYSFMPQDMRQAYAIGLLSGYKAGLISGQRIAMAYQGDELNQMIKEEGMIRKEKLKKMLDWCYIENNAPNVSDRDILMNSTKTQDEIEAKQELLKIHSYNTRQLKELEKQWEAERVEKENNEAQMLSPKSQSSIKEIRTKYCSITVPNDWITVDQKTSKLTADLAGKITNTDTSKREVLMDAQYKDKNEKIASIRISFERNDFDFDYSDFEKVEMKKTAALTFTEELMKDSIKKLQTLSNNEVRSQLVKPSFVRIGTEKYTSIMSPKIVTYTKKNKKCKETLYQVIVKKYGLFTIYTSFQLSEPKYEKQLDDILKSFQVL